MAAAAAQLLGEDGRGYELARRLEACGAWRAWLGDAAHAALAQHLASPSTWDAFLSPSPSSVSSPARPLLLLQLRVRALLFDKASAALLPRGASPAGLHSVNANSADKSHKTCWPKFGTLNQGLIRDDRFKFGIGWKWLEFLIQI